jgi:hypothetical protein
VRAGQDRRVIVRWSHRRDGLTRRLPSEQARAAREEHTVRTKRIFRSLVVAGTGAALSILSIVSAVMAASGGGDFPLRR